MASKKETPPPEPRGYRPDPEFLRELRRNSGKASSIKQRTESLSAGQEIKAPAGNCSIQGVNPTDLLVFARLNLEKLKPGNIIVYRAGTRVVARRVVRSHCEGNKFLIFTKRDDTTDLDPPVEFDQIMGTLVAVERNGRRIPAGWFGASLWAKFTGFGSRTITQSILEWVLWPLLPTWRKRLIYGPDQVTAPPPAPPPEPKEDWMRIPEKAPKRH